MHIVTVLQLALSSTLAVSALMCVRVHEAKPPQWSPHCVTGACSALFVFPCFLLRHLARHQGLYYTNHIQFEITKLLTLHLTIWAMIVGESW